ncbi:uncharacterized protein LY89DRAFT_713869 [Mollisia scopiformis]|uniref:Uncharacterized protein n=1 Tax=Mollisia scopiformis TaxID=149040 RepID=A0A194XTC4_MOLSC|nr:uncharacterized protein LY89DRAFT_713869 [Mollisia scopiformis]KUJ23396.1 hypothetical protein LY89DRAFT_713869 [Mollisia scopiformis]
MRATLILDLDTLFTLRRNPVLWHNLHLIKAASISLFSIQSGEVDCFAWNICRNPRLVKRGIYCRTFAGAETKMLAYRNMLLKRKRDFENFSSLKELTFEILDQNVNADFCFNLIQDWVQNSKNLNTLKLRIRLKYGHYGNPATNTNPFVPNRRSDPGRNELVQRVRHFVSADPKRETSKAQNSIWLTVIDLQFVGDELGMTFHVNHANLRMG